LVPPATLLPLGDLLKHFAEEDVRLLFGLYRLAEPQPAAGQRVRARVDDHPVRAAW
jgi:hypothetical protein